MKDLDYSYQVPHTAIPTHKKFLWEAFKEATFVASRVGQVTVTEHQTGHKWLVEENGSCTPLDNKDSSQ